MVSSPRMPVKRPILVFPFVNHPIKQLELLRRRSACYLIALLQQRFCARGLCVGVAVNGAERLADGNFVADLLMDDDAHGGIVRIFFALAAAAENDASGADLFARYGR